MDTYQRNQIIVIGVLIFIIWIILWVVFSWDNSEELMKISKEKESLESRITSQTSTISKLNNEVEEAEMEIKKNQAVSKELLELEKFKPLWSDKTVKELYEEEQAEIKAEKEAEQKRIAEEKAEEARKKKEQEEAEKREAQKLGISYDELIYDISYLKEDFAPLSDWRPRYFLEDTESWVTIEIIWDKENITSSTVIIPVADINSFGTLILYLKNLFPNERSIEVMTDLNEGLEKNGESYTTTYGDIRLEYKKSIAGLMLVVTSVNAE